MLFKKLNELLESNKEDIATIIKMNYPNAKNIDFRGRYYGTFQVKNTIYRFEFDSYFRELHILFTKVLLHEFADKKEAHNKIRQEEVIKENFPNAIVSKGYKRFYINKEEYEYTIDNNCLMIPECADIACQKHRKH
jgi:hypothetical protein